MLIQRTRAVRSRVASAVALLYLLCVLAPAAAFAFGDGSRAAHPLGLAVQVEEPTLRQRTILKGDKVADLPVQQAAERSGRTNLPYREHDMLVWSPTKH